MTLLEDLAKQLARVNRLDRKLVQNQIEYWLNSREALLLPSIKNINPNSVDANLIIQTVCSITGIGIDPIISKSRILEVKNARHILCYMLSIKTNMTLDSIGEMLGDRDHSTVHHSVNVCQDYMDTDSEFRLTVNKILASLDTVDIPDKLEYKIVHEWVADNCREKFTAASHIELSKILKAQPNDILRAANKLNTRNSAPRKVRGFVIKTNKLKIAI